LLIGGYVGLARELPFPGQQFVQTRSGKIGDPGEDVEPEPTTRLNTPAGMPERVMISSSSAAQANALTFNPTERNELLSDPRVSGSSSITNTIGPSESGMLSTPSFHTRVPVSQLTPSISRTLQNLALSIQLNTPVR
jgi:hypothetical protein